MTQKALPWRSLFQAVNSRPNNFPIEISNVMSLTFQVIQSDENLLKIAFSGKLDALSLAPVETKFYALINSQNSQVILDFSEVSFLASLGIRMLLTASKDVRRQGHSLKIENASEEIIKIFHIAGLSDMLS